MKPIYKTLMLSWLLCSAPALAEQSLIKLESQGDVNFVSGGVGGDERAALQAIRGDYNLNLLFSEKGTGEYLSEVNVVIKDAGGNTLLETRSEGPMLFARLKPGHYSISADWDGHTINKMANISSQHKTSLAFAWPQKLSD